MKIIVFISFCLAFAAILTEVHGKGRPRPRLRPSRRPIHAGWRHTNGTCICKGPNPSPGHHGHHGPSPSGHHGHHHGPSPRPTGHHGHHGPRPTGHHGHHGPRPSGHHGHHGPRPTGHHGHHHGPRPYPNHVPFSRCICQKSERTVRITFRMKKKFIDDLLDCKSPDYYRMSHYILTKLKLVLKMAKRFTKVKFSKGSVIVEVGVVYDVHHKEDPEKALRDAIKSGEMKDMDVYPESLYVSDSSYSGVALSGWTAAKDACKKCRHHHRRHHKHHHHGHHKEEKKDDKDDHDKDKRDHDKDEHDKDDHDGEHHEYMVFQTRTCTEIDASCDGIPLTRNASCEEACPRPSVCWWGGWARRHKLVVIACSAAVLLLVIVVVVALVKAKKSRKKYMSTSPSSSSIKELAKHDELQEQQAEPLPAKVAQC